MKNLAGKLMIALAAWLALHAHGASPVNSYLESAGGMVSRDGSEATHRKRAFMAIGARKLAEERGHHESVCGREGETSGHFR